MCVLAISDGETSYHNYIELSVGQSWKASFHKAPLLALLSPYFAGALEDLNRDNE